MSTKSWIQSVPNTKSILFYVPISQRFTVLRENDVCCGDVWLQVIFLPQCSKMAVFYWGLAPWIPDLHGHGMGYCSQEDQFRFHPRINEERVMKLRWTSFSPGVSLCVTRLGLGFQPIILKGSARERICWIQSNSVQPTQSATLGSSPLQRSRADANLVTNYWARSGVPVSPNIPSAQRCNCRGEQDVMYRNLT